MYVVVQGQIERVQPAQVLHRPRGQRCERVLSVVRLRVRVRWRDVLFKVAVPSWIPGARKQQAYHRVADDEAVDPDDDPFDEKAEIDHELPE